MGRLIFSGHGTGGTSDHVAHVEKVFFDKTFIFAVDENDCLNLSFGGGRGGRILSSLF